MDTLLLSIFGQVLPRSSVLVAVVVALLLTFMALLAYFLKAKIDSGQKESDHQSQLHDQEIASRDATQLALLSEIKESRQQMIEHLGRDRREKDRLTRTLGSMCAEIRASVKVLDSLERRIDLHCQQSADRCNELKAEILRTRFGGKHE